MSLVKIISVHVLIGRITIIPKMDVILKNQIPLCFLSVGISLATVVDFLNSVSPICQYQQNYFHLFVTLLIRMYKL